MDDELPGLAYLKLLCGQIKGVKIVKAFDKVDSFLAELPKLEFDLCLLDIEMPALNGLQVAELLGGKPVIFVTAYKEYAAEAFDLNAIDYVRKPVKKERLEQAFLKAAERIGDRAAGHKFLQINTDRGKALLYFDQLLYLKTADADSRDKLALLSDGTSLTLKNVPFEKLLPMLPEKEFVRINKQEVIAVRSVRVFSFDEITTSFTGTGEVPQKLTLGEAYRKQFLQLVS
ncbi:MAG: response regulator transcription factor [Flavitalea sp.]